MKSIRIDNIERRIYITPSFDRKASDPYNAEYDMLQKVKRDYPLYKVSVKGAKKNANKECYKGLTYEYMRNYILTHESKETLSEVIAEFNEMLLISQCHSNVHRYPTIKKWFLNEYPRVKAFGVEEEFKFEEVNAQVQHSDETRLAA